jgi:hypothetical protein
MKIGITKRGDVGIDFSWEYNLLNYNILITKGLNEPIPIVANKSQLQVKKLGFTYIYRFICKY